MKPPEYKKYQQSLVDLLKQTDFIKTPAVEAAFRKAPRHLFVPGEPLEKAYSDIAIMIRKDEDGMWTSSSSQPAIMAIMLEQLDLKPGQKVLEIGTGSGFNAALIASIVGQEGKVVTVDIQADVVEAARLNLVSAGFGWVQALAADGGYGCPEFAPYDRIIVTASSAIIPPAWREQLAPGGRLVLPFDLTGKPDKSIAFDIQDGILSSVSIIDCGFMKLQGFFSTSDPISTQVGPDSRLAVYSNQALPATGDILHEWLNQPAKDWPTGIQGKIIDFAVNLQAWLSLHLPNMAQLIATGDLADQEITPPFFGFGGEWKRAITFVLIDSNGMAALMRPPGQAAELEDINKMFEDKASFELYIRQIGPGEGAARKLLQEVKDWDQAGRPDTSKLKVLAIPAEAKYAMHKGEVMIDKPWTKIVVKYK